MPVSMLLSQCHSLHPDNRSNKVLQNDGILLQHYAAPQPRRTGIKKAGCDDVCWIQLTSYRVQASVEGNTLRVP